MKEVPTGSQQSGFVIMAPGGERAVRLYAAPSERRLSNGTLFDLSEGSKKIATVGPSGHPSGFAGLQFGMGGSFITRTPLDDAEGANGSYRFTFWSELGIEGRSVEFPRFQEVVLEQRGPGVLFIGAGEVVAHRPKEGPLWSHPGIFRAAAVTKGGDQAVLAVTRDQEQGLEVFPPGDGKGLIPTPVAIDEIRISADPQNPQKAIAFEAGRYFILDLLTRQVVEGAALPIGPPGSLQITDAAMLANGLLAFAVRLKSVPPESLNWKDAVLVVLNAQGDVIFSRQFRPSEPLGRYPRLQVSGGGRLLAGFTVNKAYVIKLQD